MKTRSVLEALGFQEDLGGFTDEPPAYVHDFGNLRLTAAHVMNRRFVPVFQFSGVVTDARSLGMVEFQMPLEIESHEQGVALIVHGIGKDFRPAIPAPWLADGLAWRDRLPWERERKAHEARPRCSVGKDWFRLAMKTLVQAAEGATDGDLVRLAFDGEALRLTVRDARIMVPATGTAWPRSYAISATTLDHLPKRLPDPVVVSVWDGRLTIARRVWTLADLDDPEPTP